MLHMCSFYRSLNDLNYLKDFLYKIKERRCYNIFDNFVEFFEFSTKYMTIFSRIEVKNTSIQSKITFSAFYAIKRAIVDFKDTPVFNIEHKSFIFLQWNCQTSAFLLRCIQVSDVSNDNKSFTIMLFIPYTINKHLNLFNSF